MRRLSSHSSILEAETLSVREALSWLKDCGYTHIVVGIDNKLLFNSVTSSDIGFSYFASLITDCKILFRLHVCCTFSWARCNANAVAHNLPRAAR